MRSIMKAARLHGYGGVDQLQWEDCPLPQPESNQLLVRVISSSMNPIDWKRRMGALRTRERLEFPVILGRDVAGEIVAPAAESLFRPGDQVMALANGTHAQFVAVNAQDACSVPQGLDLEKAGALPLVLITGAQLISEAVHPKPGQIVLVTGAAGSVGRTAIYVAKQHEAIVIAGVKSSQRDQAQALQADDVVSLDDDNQISRLPALDAIADTVGGKVLSRLLPKLKANGVLGSVLGGTDERSDIRVRNCRAHPDADRLAKLTTAIQSGEFDIPIQTRLPLSEIREAHALAQAGGGGKVLLVAN